MHNQPARTQSTTSCLESSSYYCQVREPPQGLFCLSGGHNTVSAFTVPGLHGSCLCRHAPGTLMERQGKGMDLFHAGMSIVMTDVEGSTSLWEWNSRIMNSALALHDYTLRSLLPKYFGYEVSRLPFVYVNLRNKSMFWCLPFDRCA